MPTRTATLSAVRAVLLVGVAIIAGCEPFLAEPSVVSPLRDAGGLRATCTGEPPPTIEDCRAQGEQAFIELSKPDDPVAAIGVLFGPVVNGCRDVTWRVTYASRGMAHQPSRVCGAGALGVASPGRVIGRVGPA